MPEKPEDTPKREGRLSLTIREDLLLEFKMQEVRERTSMSELIKRVIEDYLKKAEKQPLWTFVVPVLYLQLYK